MRISTPFKRFGMVSHAMKKTSLHKPRLARLEYMHSSMCGSFWTPAKLIRHLENGNAMIEFFDTVLDEWDEREVNLETDCRRV